MVWCSFVPHFNFFACKDVASGSDGKKSGAKLTQRAGTGGSDAQGKQKDGAGVSQKNGTEESRGKDVGGTAGQRDGASGNSGIVSYFYACCGILPCNIDKHGILQIKAYN